MTNFNFNELADLPAGRKGRENTAYVTLNTKLGYIYFPNGIAKRINYTGGDRVSIKYLPSNKGVVIGVAEKFNPFKFTVNNSGGTYISCRGAVEQMVNQYKTTKMSVKLEDNYIILTPLKCVS